MIACRDHPAKRTGPLFTEQKSREKQILTDFFNLNGASQINSLKNPPEQVTIAARQPLSQHLLDHVQLFGDLRCEGILCFPFFDQLADQGFHLVICQFRFFFDHRAQ
mgnify:CR=1 FL=1